MNLHLYIDEICKLVHIEICRTRNCYTGSVDGDFDCSMKKVPQHFVVVWTDVPVVGLAVNRDVARIVVEYAPLVSVTLSL